MIKPTWKPVNSLSIYLKRRKVHVWLGARADPENVNIWKWCTYTNGGKASGSKLSTYPWNAWGSLQPSTPETSLEKREELCLEYWNIDNTRVGPWNNNDCKRRQRFICQSGGLHSPDANPESLTVKAQLSTNTSTGSQIFTCVTDNPQHVHVRRPELKIRRKKKEEPSFSGDPLLLQFLNDDMTPNGDGILDTKVSGLEYTVNAPQYILTVTTTTAAHDEMTYMCVLLYRVSGSSKFFKVTDPKLEADLDADLAKDWAHSSTLDITIFVFSGLISLSATLVV